MHTARLANVLLGAWLACTLAPSVVTAAEPEPRTRYQQLVSEALVEFEASRYEEALVLFEHAYAEKPSARALRGIAKTLFELRAYARSLQAIDDALASPLDPLTGTLRDDLVALRERTTRFVGRAVVTTVPRATLLLIDGTERTCAPAKGCLLDMGPHTLRASAPGYESFERTLNIHSMAPVTLGVRLVPVRDAMAKPPSRLVPIGLGIAATTVSTAGLLVSILWFADRDAAVSRCNEAAAVGARCGNASSVATQRDASAWTVGLSSAALAASVAGLTLAVALPRARPAVVGSLACGVGGPSFACTARW